MDICYIKRNLLQENKTEAYYPVHVYASEYSYMYNRYFFQQLSSTYVNRVQYMVAKAILFYYLPP